MATAGRTIVFSALTVAVALAALLVFDDPTIRSLALAGIGVVLAALLSAQTLLPVLLRDSATGSDRRSLRAPTVRSPGWPA